MELFYRGTTLNMISKVCSAGILANGVRIQHAFSNICLRCASSKQRCKGLPACKWIEQTRLQQLCDASNMFFVFANSAVSKIFVRTVTLVESQPVFQ